MWGADGPDSWDCSGLTMGSWAAAGVYLPHYSVAQYDAVQHISFGELRAGDLVFWSSTSSPSTIYHVALYIGGSQIIQAPRPGRYVEVASIYDWILPNLYGRV
ncbi:MAG: NlpC/P60 family protein [Nocardioidaceae bacterium]